MGDKNHRLCVLQQTYTRLSFGVTVPENSYKKTKYILISFAILAIPAAFYGTPYILDLLNKINQPPTACSQIDPNEVFCEERYFDDGHVRFSSTTHERQNCCILERLMTNTDIVSYRILACDALNQSQIQCGNIQSYGINRWRIDNRELEPDLNWEDHYSQFIHE